MLNVCVRSGRCETIGTDERFLPFEGAGVISKWRLELPGQYPQFDYSTISDVVLTIRYTARDGGESLRDSATTAIATQLTAATDERLRFNVLLSCKSDFPTEWAGRANAASLTLTIKRELLLPYWMVAAGLQVTGVRYADLPVAPAAALQFVTVTYTAPSASVTMTRVPAGRTDRLIILEVGRNPGTN